MKPDLSAYPEIPPGCLVNENKIFNLFQIYKNVKTVDPETGKTKYIRETVGSIKNGVFTFSKTYLLKKENIELASKLHTEGKSEDEKSVSSSSSDNNEPNSEKQVCTKIDEALKKTSFDQRDSSKIEIPMLTIVLGSIISALAGDTGCAEISEAINGRLKKYFNDNNMGDLVVDNCSHDNVRKAFLLVEADTLSELYTELIKPLIKEDFRVIAADGQALRATGKTTPENNGKHGAYMLMNFYDATNRVCLYHKLIQKKENEISVGPESLNKLNLTNSVVTADAMSCQIDFVNTVIGKGAHYCLSLKGNQNKSFDEVRYLFNSTPKNQIISYEPEITKEHGRIEQYKISLISGRRLSKIIKEKWLGLDDGSIVKVERNCYQQTTKNNTWEQRFYITSLPPIDENSKRVNEIIRHHWGIENNLHWCLDMRYNQDRIQANNPNYIANRSALNKLALAYLENYRYWLWNKGREKEKLSLNILQKRCYDPKAALECVACSLGLV